MLSALPGGAAWDSSGNPAAAAAAEEAATGAWLAELERGDPSLLKTAAPGMGRGLFGGWAEEDGLAAVDEAGRHLAVLELEEAAEQETQQAAQQAQQGQQAQQKVSLDDLFRWVPTPALLSSVGSPPSFADLLPVPRSRDWLGRAQSVPP